jgi:hypothetical protein
MAAGLAPDATVGFSLAWGLAISKPPSGVHPRREVFV